MARRDPKDQEERARIIAASALVVLALMAFMLVIGAPRDRGGAAQRAEQPRPLAAPTALHRANLVPFETAQSACRTALRNAGIEITIAPDVREGVCGYRNAVELTQSLHPYSSPVTTSCALAAALVLWERDVVAPAAARHLHQGVARIELAGPAYSCRPIAGRADGRMSEHASANAIDIGGFTLEDGRVVTLAQGWSGSAEDRAFLRAVRTGACDLFQVVLSPDYNRAHRDHLHLDMGRYAMCR